MKYLDLSGYAFTGKHAVIDLMREFDGFHVEPFDFEFALLRIQGGIHDLEYSLVDNWSPIRSDAAIRRFRRLVSRVGSKNRWSDPKSWFESMGWNYDEHYSGQFFSLSRDYVNSLVAASWSANWPFAAAELGAIDLFLRKLATKLGLVTLIESDMSLARPEAFAKSTREYLDKLLTSNVASNTRTVVLHNAFEPFDPARSFHFFSDARAIAVDRDPRDNYVQSLTYGPTAADPMTFIKRYRLYRDANARIENPRVLRIKFEDLVLDYDRSVARVLNFLGEDPRIHSRPKQFFDPAISKKNVGLWRTHPRPADIDLIASELHSYCDPRVS